jgi:nitronate monooxygenase
MDVVATAALASAVSDAGGLGLIGGGYGDEAWLRKELSSVPPQTVGCGFITWSADPKLVEIALEHRPSVLFLSFGDAAPYIEPAHERGVPVVCQVHNLEQVRASVDLGADVICVQGGEAGGHGIGGRSTLTLVPETADLLADRAPGTLLLAAGGIADGRALAAVLALGADGALVGTRFWATTEAQAPATAKSIAVTLSGDQTRRTSVYDIVRDKAWPKRYTGRVFDNDFVHKWHGHEDELRANIAAAKQSFQDALADEDYHHANVIVGEAIGLVRSVRSAAEVVSDMANQAERIMRSQTHCPSSATERSNRT